MTNLFDIYIKQIESDLLRGTATEHSYRPALKQLLETLAPGISAANDPKHIACGAPDFIVERNRVPLGYVETKDIGTDLDKVEKSDQLKRYLHSLNNLILTDYLEFRWYVNGKRKLISRLAVIGPDGNLISDSKGTRTTEQLINEFFKTEVPVVGTPKDLAERMAQITRLIANLIAGELQSEENRKSSALYRQYQAFRDHLLPALKTDEFSDIYAQTMAYGLFAARLSSPEGGTFNRTSAYQYLTPNRFLRKLFLDVGEELEGTLIAPFLDDLAALLGRADMGSILRDFGKHTRKEDPVVHFYETFLAAYNPRLRECRGVYNTPEPVVQFMVNSVDWLLKEKFDCLLGLADPSVFLLDPATGTSTFLYFVIRLIHETLVERKQAGTWQDYVQQKLLPRMFGFELLMAPYVIAHLKLSLLLKELGYQWGKEDRLRIYLTNSLDEAISRSDRLGDLGWYISQEASEAAEVKNKLPIMVVMGNPPYSGHSENKGRWIDELVRDYYWVDGKPLGERNPKWLQDDYVKFIRFAQWRIEQTGHGILAFITNNGYLDNPTFRGMRQNLLSSFDEIYVLDLHGSSKKKERTPEGDKDENVFDIQQGVAILIAVKLAGKPGKSDQPAQVFQSDLWGLRKNKYSSLVARHAGMRKWRKLKPAAPFFALVYHRTKLQLEYFRYWQMSKIMPVNVLGFQTHRDSFAIDMERLRLKQRIREMRDQSITNDVLRRKYNLKDNRDWQLEKARKNLRKNTNWEEAIILCLYRPFDQRYCYFDEVAMDYPRRDLVRHVANRDNYCLGLGRQGLAVNDPQWTLVSVSCDPIDANVFRRGGVNVFPLYLYPNGDFPADLFDHENGRRPNLSEDFIKQTAERLNLNFIPEGKGDLKKTFGPEDIFHYAYAIFHSPTYRQRYAEFLKIDFPRLPVTSDRKLFARLASKGAELVGLHLLKSPVLDDYITSYPIAGDHTVGRILYDKKRVWINETQYFGGVPENVWEFTIGGYQVCEKWLKDRKGRQLDSDDLVHYQRMIVAIKETLRLMEEIDRIIPGWPIE